jgi:hypothetical protein
MFMVHVQRRLRRWRLRMRSLFVAKSWTVIASDRHCERSEAIQNCFRAGSLDCFVAEPVIGPAEGRTL